MLNNEYFCPVGQWDCPYYNQGQCELNNPQLECDDYALISIEDEEEIEYLFD